MLVLALAANAVFLQPAFSATPASVEARAERNFGRLIFKFARMPKIESNITSGVLVISLSEPVAIDLANILRALPDYIGIARVDPGGRAIRLGLNRSYRSNAMEVGDRLFIDLMPPEWRGAPPQPPPDVIREIAELAARAEVRARETALQKAEATKTATLNIETGVHPTFTRLVFDWSEFTMSDLTRVGEKVTVAFGRRAPAELGRLNADPPAHLKSAAMRETADGMEIVLAIEPETGVRGFREGLSYVVDLSGPAAPVAVAIAETPPPGELADAPKPDGGEAPAQKLDEVTPASVISIEKRALAPGDLGAANLGDNAAPLPEVAPVPANAAAAAPALKASARAEPPAPAVPSGPVVVTASNTDGDLRLTFPFGNPVPASVFRRAGHVWIVFDSARKIDSAAIGAASDSVIGDISHIVSGPMQAIRVTLNAPALAFAQWDGSSWVVILGERAASRAEKFEIERSRREDGGAVVSVPIPDGGRVHWLDDPAVGDRLAVVTVPPPVRNMDKPRDFVEFAALDTAHGLAFAAKTDDIAVRMNIDRLLIARQEGLTLSSVGSGNIAEDSFELTTPVAAMFARLRTPLDGDPGAVRDALAMSANNIATGPEDTRNAARLALAGRYAGEGLAAEAFGLLGEVRRADPEAASDPVFLALNGVTLTLMKRTGEARKALSAHALARDPDAALWRGLAAADAGDAAQSLTHFTEGGGILPSWRDEFQARFRLAALRAALETKDASRAAAELSGLQNFAKMPQSFVPELRLLEGLHHAQGERNTEALAAFETAMKMGDRKVAAEAELALIGLQLAAGDMTNAAAIPKLEGLSLSWRGDDVEVRTLRLLARTSLAERKYADAFATMKAAIRFHPHSEIARAVQDDMRVAFDDLFLKGGADEMDTVEALGLYYAYRELTPPGPLGDELIRRLADRLIDVDLLDQATRLLAHQVENRLNGAGRAQVATRLAIVHLMNRRPEQALRAIQTTRQSGLPEDLQRDRTLLEARALAELGRAESAIELLGAEEGGQADRIRADALWTAQKWSEAGGQLEKMLGGSWREGATLTDAERFDVLRAAISFALVEDQLALDRIRKKFYEKMVSTPDAGSFLLITEAKGPRSATDLRGLARQIAGADTLDAFLRDYRTRFESGVPEPGKREARIGGAS